MQGKKEHVDAVSNDGTWHMQLEGSKTWTIRADPDHCWQDGVESVPGAGPRKGC